jgi:hypothetical protein
MDAVVFNPEGFAGAPVFEPGSVSTEVFELDSNTQKYLSYASMIIPSNDAFVANGGAQEHPIFDDEGDFIGPFSFIVYGSQVRDAGTEENTETDAAFLNQSAANTGVSTSDVIAVHPGFNGSIGNPDALPVNILGGTVASGDVIDVDAGDFSKQYYPIMRITVSENSFPVRVSIKNSSPENGTFLTPFWVAFHDGVFDTYNLGEVASAGLEKIAEDGDPSTLSQEFNSIGSGFDTVITNPEGFAGAPLFDPGFSSQQVFDLNASNRYFSYAAMLLPSNDAFIANGNPKGHMLFDENGRFNSLSIKISGSQVRDAGTEDNTESDAAFFNQTAANTGIDSNSVVSTHLGFNASVGNPDGSPQVFLGGSNPAGFTFDTEVADFSIEGSQIAEINVSRLVDGSFSGTWYDPSRSGEGFVIEVTEDATSGETKAVVSWYTYTADNSGAQSWLIGAGPVIADTALVDLSITQGTGFGADFNSSDVVRTPWGQLTIKFTGCDSAKVNYESLNPEFGTGELFMQRLTSGPIDYQGACTL